MKCIRVNEPKSIKLIPIGDSHVGSREFDKEKYESIINWVKKQKDARVILMGDEIDNGLKDSVGAGTFDNTMTPQEQIEYVIDILMPIKNKIWGIVNGNHHQRTTERTSIDITKIKAKIGKVNYVIYATHGSSGATSPSGKINAVLKLGSFIDADLFLHGHLHELATHTTEYFRVSIQNKMTVKDKRHYLITGHFLKYGGYAQAKGYAPGKTGVAKILLNGNTKDVHVSI